MKYNIIEIRPDLKHNWTVSSSFDNADRVRGVSVPNALGFYHYPAHFGEERAFNKLKAFMVKRHKQEIRNLTRSLKKLENFKFPKKK